MTNFENYTRDKIGIPVTFFKKHTRDTPCNPWQISKPKCHGQKKCHGEKKLISSRFQLFTSVLEGFILFFLSKISNFRYSYIHKIFGSQENVPNSSIPIPKIIKYSICSGFKATFSILVTQLIILEPPRPMKKSWHEIIVLCLKKIK